MNRPLNFTIILALAMMSCTSAMNKDKSAPTLNLKERVFYEIFVHAFYDSNGDGIGDLNGVTAKLDYLADLGITGLWLLPVHPSPSYHKYDVIDYYGIHPDYGSMADMERLLEEAHKRNMLVLLDMVVNHSSDEHFFFTESRKGKDNAYRDYYVWSSDSLLWKENSHHWHKNGKDPEKYYGFFWKGMPDLNFDQAAVRDEMKKIGKYWLEEVGVDGYRLDAIRYIYPDSLMDMNVEWWQEYRSALEETGKDFFTVAELWAEADYIAPFLDQGVHAAFNFDLSFAIEDMLLTGKDPGIGELLANVHHSYDARSKDWYDALFVKNHDQDRIMSILSDEGKARLAASLLLTLPGIPFLYYGEEIAMQGKKPDEHIREPMVWDLPGKDPGQTRWIEARYSTHETIIPVSLQEEDPSSVLSHYKRLIALRRAHPVLALGSVSGLDGLPEHICGYALQKGNSQVRVFHNLSGEIIALDAALPGAAVQILYPEASMEGKGEEITLEAYGTLVLKLGGES